MSTQHSGWWQWLSSQTRKRINPNPWGETQADRPVEIEQKSMSGYYPPGHTDNLVTNAFGDQFDGPAVPVVTKSDARRSVRRAKASTRKTGCFAILFLAFIWSAIGIISGVIHP
jgi:hypothetical protein